MSDYYDGGRRVVCDGVPCKVYSRPSAATREVKARIAHVLAGTMDWTPVEGAENFTFVPPADCAKAAPKVVAPTVSCSKAGKDYYKGGHRLVIDGVPVRVASKPSKNRLALLRQNKAFAPYSKPDALPMTEDAA